MYDIKNILKGVCNTLSGFDVTAVAVVGCEYDQQVFKTTTLATVTATKACTLSDSTAPVMWLHGLSLTSVVLVQGGVSTTC